MSVRVLAAVAFLLLMLFSPQLTGRPALAQLLCDCCTPSSLARTCQKACEAQGALDPSGEGFCRPVILPDFRAGKRRTNPLNGIDLKYLDLSGLTPAQLERVRRWAERARRQSEARFRRIKAKARRGRISKEAFAQAEARRDEVVTNYHHIIRAYRDAITRLRAADASRQTR